jgi:hypothetical protein
VHGPPILVVAPIIRWQRHSPNISRLVEFDSAVERLLWIDINHSRRSTFIGQVDMNYDAHADTERDRRRNQGTMKIHDNGFAFTNQLFRRAPNVDDDSQRNPCAPARLAERLI